jgi:protein involved in ribonucleotide reduction
MIIFCLNIIKTMQTPKKIAIVGSGLVDFIAIYCKAGHAVHHMIEVPISADSVLDVQ